MYYAESALGYGRMPAPLKVKEVTPPQVEPVTPGDVANFAKLTTTDDNTLLATLITAGRRYVEDLTRHTLINTTFNLYLDFFPSVIYLPQRPLQTVNEITYVDPNLETQTLSTDRYLVDDYGPRPIVIPPLGSFFPIARVQYPNAVVVNFTAGFGDTADDVPEGFKLAIMQWVATNYSQREAVVMGRTAAVVPHTFDYLIKILSLPEV